MCSYAWKCSIHTFASVNQTASSETIPDMAAGRLSISTRCTKWQLIVCRNTTWRGLDDDDDGKKWMAAIRNGTEYEYASQNRRNSLFSMSLKTVHATQAQIHIHKSYFKRKMRLTVCFEWTEFGWTKNSRQKIEKNKTQIVAATNLVFAKLPTKTQLIQFQFDVKRPTVTLFRSLTLRQIDVKSNSLAAFFLNFACDVTIIRNGEKNVVIRLLEELDKWRRQRHRKTMPFVWPPQHRKWLNEVDQILNGSKT